MASKKTPPDIPLIEWIVGGIGLVLVTSMIALLAYEEIAGDSSPPDVVLKIQSRHHLQQNQVISVTVMNQGGEPASTVKIQGELLNEQGDVVESALSEIDYLPARSEREAGLIFTRPTENFQVKLRALGYEKP